ncbi:hypothetical protein A0H81_04345 [Grifola frondosa]|uniref:Uncharacterized protein n=1 Tax=Grifola frondosa TaxID=5627 RepID=A0A1C7MHH3_GRIFR|nr:hypothetical protein A0H81_04345 [Grifola frondosa]
MASLPSQMQYSEDQQLEFDQLCNKIEKIAESFLDVNISLKHQGREWKLFTQAVSQELPQMNSFEDLWPLKVIYYRYNYRSKHRSGAQRQSPDAYNGRGVASRYIHTTPTNTVRKRGRPQRPRNSSRHTGKSLNRAAYESRSASQSSHRESPAGQARTPRASRSAPISNTSQSADHREPIRAFLRSLQQPLDALLPTFLEIGINTQSSLEALARLPDRRKWVFTFVTQGLIDGFQFKMIMDGLEELGRNGHA